MTFRKGFPAATAVAFLLWIGNLPSQAQELPPALVSPPAGSPGETASGGNDNAARTGILWNMDNVVRIALSRHPLVGQADAETAAAVARKGQAKAAYYPTVRLQSGYSDFAGFSSSSGRNISVSNIDAEGNVTQVLTDFGRRSAGFRRAESLLSASREARRTTRQDVAFQAKVAYFNVLRAGRILAVNRETVSQREAFLRQARAFYEAGIRARIDVARAEANVYDARADLTAAENDLRVARITLLNRMGVDGPRDFELVDTLAAEVVPGTIAGWIREAEENRPELSDLVFRRLAAEEAVRAASADHRPVLSAEGGYGYANEEFPLRKTHIISILFEVPLFTGFLTSERVREAEASLSAAVHAETDRRRSVRLEVEQASLSVREASERFGARRKEQEASGENLHLARERYKVGAGDIIEMIDAQVQMTRSETDVIEALYDSSISAATLLRAVGR